MIILFFYSGTRSARKKLCFVRSIRACFVYLVAWPSYFLEVPSLELVRAIGARDYVRSSFSQREQGLCEELILTVEAGIM